MATLTRENAVRPWINRGLVDLFVAFEQFDLIPFHLFCLHQGLEKLGKAYLVASQAARYERQELTNATYWIESFVRRHGHDLSELIGILSVGIPHLKPWLADPFIDLLEGAYEEGRYPKPSPSSVFKRHGFPAVATHRNQEKVFTIANDILTALENDFGIVVSIEDALTQVELDDIERFKRIFQGKLKRETSETALSKSHRDDRKRGQTLFGRSSRGEKRV